MYDAKGNLLQQVRLADGALTSYCYDPENRLRWVGTPPTVVTFRYDALGRRIERTVTQDSGGGEGDDDGEEGPPPRVTRYLYDGEDILVTFNRRDRERARYLHGPGIDEPLAQIRPVGTRFYHADVLGSIIALTDSAGTLERRYRYDAFGVPQDHLKDPQPYRYTGREWDRDTGLYYYRARYYNALRGRFVRQDPPWWIGNGSYAYVHNKPLDFLDPLGLQATLPFSGPFGGPLMPPFPLLPSPQLSTGQVQALQHDLANLAALLDPRPLGEYLFSKVLDKIKNGEPLTPEDIAELGNAPTDLVCEIRLPSAAPEPPIDPKNPRPPEGGWEKVKFILAQILRLFGQYAGRR